MILFLISVAVYVGLLLLIRPAPASLRSDQLTYGENFKCVWATVLAGVLVLFIHLLTTNFSFVTVDENIYNLLALNNDKEKSSMWPLQSITSLFIHGNLIHLLANVSGLGIASVYERRVGAKRFSAVLLVGSLASIPSILFYSETLTVCGISGGVFGLAAAWFTDENELSVKEWLAAILLFLGLALMLAIDAEFNSNSGEAWAMRIDHIGHLMGAAGAIIYCRLKPQRLAKANTEAIKAPASPPL